jgi:hypothetical protein
MGRGALVPLVLLLSGVSAVAAHPRLFLDADKLAAVRQAITTHPHHRGAYAMMRARIEWGIAGYDGRSGYARSAYVREAAFVYALTGDKRFAGLAYEGILAADGDEDKAHTGYGLSRAMMSMGFALAYDWAWQGWTPAQRSTVLGILKRAADAWPEFHHPNVEAAHKGSNWVGVTRGGELLLHLSARGDGDYGSREERIALCLRDLKTHIGTAYGESGWTQEGLGYLEYTFGFLAPAVMASGDAELLAAFKRRDWARLAMNAISFRAGGERVQTGVDGEKTSTEGLASLVLALTAGDALKEYLWWYDRHAGHRAQQPHYDRRRAGTVWALLFYPAHLEARETTPIPLSDAAKGVMFWRNAFRDRDDILISMAGRHDHHRNAWSQAETWQLGILAFDTAFALGPGKERAVALYSKPLMDGAVEKNAGLGRQIADGHWDAAKAFGVERAERKFAVRFDGGGAVVTINDAFADSQDHEWTWQLRPQKDLEIRKTGDCAASILGARGSMSVEMTPPCALETAGLVQFRVPRAKQARFQIRLTLRPASEDRRASPGQFR